LLVALPLLALAASPARADSWFGIQGGVAVPLGDSDWTDLVESSPKLNVNAGSVGKTVGGMASFDWTPENTDTTSSTFPGGSSDVSAHRFRGLVGLAFQNPITSKLYFTGRMGVGIDIAHASYTVSFLGASAEWNGTDVGPAFEVGAGIWVKVGSMLVGGEAAIPVAHHDDAGDQNSRDIAFQYTSYDFDVLFGVRFLTGSSD
jgi:hypothetical protein